MNSKNLQQIFHQYIDKFDYVNNLENQEYYKWQICKEFPMLMQNALTGDINHLDSALNEVRKCTKNIIDSYTQPMRGLVELARKDKERVLAILKNLYADDGGDIKIRMEKIADFIYCCDELLDKFFSGSYRFKQNAHSASALLFLNDPDHHYMFKANQCLEFADCIEFYDSWGSGDNIKLDVFHRMCDELVESIKECHELLATDASRFDGRLKLVGEQKSLHQDTEKHILAFDIIYCCSTYKLYNSISYTKRNSKEKELYIANKLKAEQLLQEYETVSLENEKLKEALEFATKLFSTGDIIKHPKFGSGMVKAVEGRYLDVDFPEKEIRISLPVVISNGLMISDKAGYSECIAKYRDILKNGDSISTKLELAEKELKPYLQYLD